MAASFHPWRQHEACDGQRTYAFAEHLRFLSAQKVQCSRLTTWWVTRPCWRVAAYCRTPTAERDRMGRPQTDRLRTSTRTATQDRYRLVAPPRNGACAG